MVLLTNHQKYKEANKKTGNVAVSKGFVLDASSQEKADAVAETFIEEKKKSSGFNWYIVGAAVVVLYLLSN